jgi:hypothetical protein
METIWPLDISILPDFLAICRLPPGSALPERIPSAALWSVTATNEEISLVLPEEHLAPGWKAEKGWRCLKVRGPLQFDQTGILASIAVPLADAGIPFFALSTFDTDYFLVKEEDLAETSKALQKAGHEVS